MPAELSDGKAVVKSGLQILFDLTMFKKFSNSLLAFKN